MSKVIFATNMTLDGYFGHEDGVGADEELHQYYADLMRGASVELFGRKTYQLMFPYWHTVAEEQTESPAIIEFAQAIDSIDKIVFSRTLKSVEMKNTRLASASLEEEVEKLKQQPGKAISVGSLSLAAQLSKIGLIDEYRIAIHPVMSGRGPRLFETGDLEDRLLLELIDSKQFSSGVVVLHYKKK
jgi:dihydrofolate reductase